MINRFWLVILRGQVQLIEAPTLDAAKIAAEPAFDGEQPDETYDLTDQITTAAARLVSIARERTGQGAQSVFRYAVGVVFDIWRGADPPDEWQERHAKEFEARVRAENELARVVAENAALKLENDALKAAEAST
jgi:hypothetical protein